VSNEAEQRGNGALGLGAFDATCAGRRDRAARRRSNRPRSASHCSSGPAASQCRCSNHRLHGAGLRTRPSAHLADPSSVRPKPATGCPLEEDAGCWRRRRRLSRHRRRLPVRTQWGAAVHRRPGAVNVDRHHVAHRVSSRPTSYAVSHLFPLHDRQRRGSESGARSVSTARPTTAAPSNVPQHGDRPAQYIKRHLHSPRSQLLTSIQHDAGQERALRGRLPFGRQAAAASPCCKCGPHPTGARCARTGRGSRSRAADLFRAWATT
jgi:hypothetical protein